MPGEKFLHGNQSRAVLKIGKNSKFGLGNSDYDDNTSTPKEEMHPKKTTLHSDFGDKKENEGKGKKRAPRTWVDLAAQLNQSPTAIHALDPNDGAEYTTEIENKKKDNAFGYAGYGWQDTDSSAAGGAPGSDTSSLPAAALIPGIAPFPPPSSVRNRPPSYSPVIQDFTTPSTALKRPLTPVSRAYQDRMLYRISNEPLYLMPFNCISASEGSLAERFRLENQLRVFVERENRLRDVAWERAAAARD